MKFHLGFRALMYIVRVSLLLTSLQAVFARRCFGRCIIMYLLFSAMLYGGWDISQLYPFPLSPSIPPFHTPVSDSRPPAPVFVTPA